MSIVRSGTFVRSGGESAAIAKVLKVAKLNAARRITVAFDPFGQNVKHVRELAALLSAPRLQNANPYCLVKTEIVCNRQEPTVTVALQPDFIEKFGADKILIKSGNLTSLEVIKILHKHLTPLAPIEEVIESVKTKAGKRKK